MLSIKEQNAIAEVVYYLKGIKQEDIEKIPKKIIDYLNENASKEYKCTFDYNQPLKDLNLLDETRGIIGLICYKYWCVTEEQKKCYLKKLTENEIIYQETLEKKYNADILFENRKQKEECIQKNEENSNIVMYKETVFQKIIMKIRKWWSNIIKK